VRVPDPARARVLIQAAIAVGLLGLAVGPGPAPALEVTRAGTVCALGEARERACACASWSGALRLLAGLRVPLDRASAADLEAVPGLGPARARAIVADRERHGPLPSVDALVRVAGIGPATMARVRPWLVASGAADCGGADWS
jgi:competence ComEA-like helix-hairpin-helix protein